LDAYPPYAKGAVSYFRRPVIKFSRHVGFVPDNVALGQVHLQVLPFSFPIIVPPMLHIHLSSAELMFGSLEAATAT
jgi:hypothetical protein